MARYDFASDTAAGAMPEALDALVRFNGGFMAGYGELMRTVTLDPKNIAARVEVANLLVAGNAPDRAADQAKAILALDPGASAVIRSPTCCTTCCGSAGCTCGTSLTPGGWRCCRRCPPGRAPAIRTRSC